MRSVPFSAFLEALLTEQITGKQRNQLVFGDGNIYLATPTTATAGSRATENAHD